jgi:HEAT repeat protein
LKYEEKEKYLKELIEGNQSEFDFEMIKLLSKDKDNQIRYLVAEAVGNLEQPKLGEILYELLYDSSYLVRIQAIQSIPDKIDSKLWEKIKDMSQKDKNYLVRGYALGAYSNYVEFSDITSMREFVFDRLDKEKYGFNKIFAYSSLYMLGDERSIYPLIRMFDSKNYRNKCAVLNSLLDILNEKNKDIIKQFVDKKNKNKFPNSIQPLFDELVEELAKL